MKELNESSMISCSIYVCTFLISGALCFFFEQKFFIKFLKINLKPDNNNHYSHHFTFDNSLEIFTYFYFFFKFNVSTKYGLNSLTGNYYFFDKISVLYIKVY